MKQKLLIVLAIFGVCSIPAAYVYNQTVGFAIFVGSEEGAVKNLDKNAKDMNYIVAGKSCAETDSDHDGYISCTGRFREVANGPEVKELLECGSGAWGARTGGCKPKLGVFPMQPAVPSTTPAPAAPVAAPATPPPALK